MDCARIRELGIADEYRSGRLSHEEAEAYEEHFFGCTECFEELQFGDRLAAYLQEEGGTALPAAEAAPQVPVDRPTARASSPTDRDRPRRPDREPPQRPAPDSRPHRWWLRPAPGPAWGWGLALVASTVFVVGLVATRAEREERLHHLIQPLPHPYLSVETRGGPAGVDFEAAMKLYVGGQYAEAATGLESVLEDAPDDVEVIFFLGVARLLAGQPIRAREALRRAVEADPQSPLYRWYLAQSLAACGDLRAAQSELERLIRDRSPYAVQAEGLRSQIRSLL